MRKIVTIEPSKFNSQIIESPVFTKRRVAGYARVSTDHDEQATSYEAQMQYYTDYITSRVDWTFVKMYSDEGITGTNTKSRTGFKEMISDALSGKIDLIITKSVSRFARNTVDSLTTVRKLKEAGVEIYFEKENIWTFDSKGELLITIMSSLAQEESRSISENVKWGKRKQFERGKVSIPFGITLGFDRGEHGELVINQEQAKVVRHIYHEFLTGKNCNTIAKELTTRGVPTPMGKKNWTYGTIRRILQNEKYKGDALLQKTFVTDFLTKTTKVNEGELPQYYVENNHEAIIPRETFDLVQAEFERGERRKISSSIFSGKLICASCGSTFGSKVWHSNSKYRRVIYRCNQKYEREEKCQTPHVTEDDIKAWFLGAINQILENKMEILDNLNQLFEIASNTSRLEEEQISLQNQLEAIAHEVEELIQKNTRVVQNQDEYQKRYQELEKYYEETKSNLTISSETLEKRRRDLNQLSRFISTLKAQEKLVSEFDEELWHMLVEYVTISNDKTVTFRFKSGLDIVA